METDICAECIFNTCPDGSACATQCPNPQCTMDAECAGVAGSTCVLATQRCTDDPTVAGCRTNADCTMPGETCFNGACTLSVLPGSCNTNADCTMPGEQCVSNMCTLVGPPTGCNVDSDCQPNERCVNRACVVIPSTSTSTSSTSRSTTTGSTTLPRLTRPTSRRPLIIPNGARVVTNNTNCVDRMLRTRPFDCAELARLCDDKTYRDIMTHQCPLTCRRCNEAAANGSPVGCDDAKVQGRFSDCPANEKYCRHPVYEALMALICPKTCGYCARE